MTAPKTAQSSAQPHSQPPAQPAITNLTASDAEHIWHLHGPIPPLVAPKLVESAEGVNLHFVDGRTLIDGISSWWAACHDHSHPKLVTAAQKQATTMLYVMFDGFTHRPTIELAEKLLKLMDPGFGTILYSDSGLVSVEVVIKVAL